MHHIHNYPPPYVFFPEIYRITIIIDSREKGIGNSIKLNQHLLYHACLGISHLKGVKQSKGQEESQEEKKLEARNGEYNTPVGYSKVLEDPQED